MTSVRGLAQAYLKTSFLSLLANCLKIAGIFFYEGLVQTPWKTFLLMDWYKLTRRPFF